MWTKHSQNKCENEKNVTCMGDQEIWSVKGDSWTVRDNHKMANILSIMINFT